MKNPIWSTDHNKFINAFQAISYAAVHTPHIPVKFELLEEEFDAVNWLIEPAQSFAELCDIRAAQLRHKYDRLVLFFSGGTDSITVYNTFKRLKLHIDEIIIYYHDQDEHGHPAQNVKWLKDHHWDLTTIITVYHRDENFDTYTSLNDDWTCNPAITYSPSPFINHSKIIERTERWRGQSWAAILGAEKPHVYYSDGKWFSTHLDKIYSAYANLDSAFEWFFTSPDLIDLHVKQTHMLVNGMINSNYPIPNGWNSLRFAEQNVTTANFIAAACGRDSELILGLTYLQRTWLSKNPVNTVGILNKNDNNFYTKDDRFKSYIAGLLAMQTDQTIISYMKRHNRLPTDGSIDGYHGQFGKFRQVR